MTFTKDDFTIFRMVNNKLNSIAEIFYAEVYETKLGEATLDSIDTVCDEFVINYKIHGWKIKPGTLDEWRSEFNFMMFISLELFNDDKKLKKYITSEVQKVIDYIISDEN